MVRIVLPMIAVGTGDKNGQTRNAYNHDHASDGDNSEQADEQQEEKEEDWEY